MAKVVLLRGVNVGGHRTFRPAVLATQLKHLDVINIGAAGTFVVRRSLSQTVVREEFAKGLPFETEIVMVDGKAVTRLITRDWFQGFPVNKEITRFVSVLARKPRLSPTLPLTIPATGKWLLRVLAREDRFVIGMYRREMKAIGHLGKLDALFGAPATTRNWNTLAQIVKTLGA